MRRSTRSSATTSSPTSCRWCTSSRSPLLLMVHPSVPVKSVPEFIAYAKANPDKLSAGSGGHGSTGHMAGALFQMLTGTKMVHLPYRGEVAGDDRSAWRPGAGRLRHHRLRAVLRQGRHRSRARRHHADSARLAAGHTGRWRNSCRASRRAAGAAVCVPKNTPAEIVALLNKEINAALAAPRSGSVLDLGGVPAADRRKRILAQRSRTAKVVNCSIKAGSRAGGTPEAFATVRSLTKTESWATRREVSRASVAAQ